MKAEEYPMTKLEVLSQAHSDTLLALRRSRFRPKLRKALLEHLNQCLAEISVLDEGDPSDVGEGPKIDVTDPEFWKLRVQRDGFGFPETVEKSPGLGEVLTGNSETDSEDSEAKSNDSEDSEDSEADDSEVANSPEQHLRLHQEHVEKSLPLGAGMEIKVTGTTATPEVVRVPTSPSVDPKVDPSKQPIEYKGEV